MLCAGHSLQVRMLVDRQLRPASECGPGFCHGSLSKCDAVICPARSVLSSQVVRDCPEAIALVTFPYQAHSASCTVAPGIQSLEYR